MMCKMFIASETFVRDFDFVIGSMVPETPFNIVSHSGNQQSFIGIRVQYYNPVDGS